MSMGFVNNCPEYKRFVENVFLWILPKPSSWNGMPKQNKSALASFATLLFAIAFPSDVSIPSVQESKNMGVYKISRGKDLLFCNS